VINNCYSVGNIQASGGGITGQRSGQSSGLCIINNCYASGAINSSLGGGICARFTGTGSGTAIIRNCFSNGTSSISNPITLSGGQGDLVNGNFTLATIQNGLLNSILNTSVPQDHSGNAFIADNLDTQQFPLLLSFRSFPWKKIHIKIIIITLNFLDL